MFRCWELGVGGCLGVGCLGVLGCTLVRMRPSMEGLTLALYLASSILRLLFSLIVRANDEDSFMPCQQRKSFSQISRTTTIRETIRGK